MLLGFTFLLTSCDRMIPIHPTSTASLRPTRTSSPTITPSQSITPLPTWYEEPTISAFQTLMASVCPTTTPPADKGTATVLVDADILRQFAGTYVASTGLWGFRLIVDCDGTFHEGISTDTGNFFGQNGEVVVRNKEIILNGANAFGKMYVAYLPVRWGERKYLIELDRIADFCKATQSTGRYREPRGDPSYGLYYLRDGDEKIEVTGFPISPSGKKLCKQLFFLILGKLYARL